MRQILIVIDMQNDFVDGSLGTKEAEAIVENVKAKIRSYSPGDVFFTRDTHQPDYLETQEGKNLPVEHCIEGTKGWQIRDDLADLVPDAKVFDKPTFGSLDLAEEVKAIAFEEGGAENVEVEIIGLCTDICVVSNALLLKANLPEMKISVDAACCAGVTPESHLAALTTMKMCQVQVENE